MIEIRNVGIGHSLNNAETPSVVANRKALKYALSPCFLEALNFGSSKRRLSINSLDKSSLITKSFPFSSFPFFGTF